MLRALGTWPGRCDCSCGRWAGASSLPLNSSGERTSTRFLVPIAATTSSREALIDEVAAHRVLEVLLPVDPDGVPDVVLVVRRGVLVDLDEDDLRVVQVGLDPVGVYQDVATAHVLLLRGGCGCCGGWGGFRGVH